MITYLGSSIEPYNSISKHIPFPNTDLKQSLILGTPAAGQI